MKVTILQCRLNGKQLKIFGPLYPPSPIYATCHIFKNICFHFLKNLLVDLTDNGDNNMITSRVWRHLKNIYVCSLFCSIAESCKLVISIKKNIRMLIFSN